MGNTNKQNFESEARKRLYDFYKSVNEGTKIFSYEELEIAIEALEILQQKARENATLTNKSTAQKKKRTTKSTGVRKNAEKTIKDVLQIPNFNWFVSNRNGTTIIKSHSGSYRMDPQKGHFSTTTFNYKIWIKYFGKETEELCASSFVQTPWWCGFRREDVQKSSFESSPQGLNAAKKWLNCGWRRFMNSGSKKR